MAIVINKAQVQDPLIDKPWHTYNRTAAASPNGVLTPQYAGEIVFDTTNKVLWRAIGLLNSEWIPMQAEVT